MAIPAAIPGAIPKTIPVRKYSAACGADLQFDLSMPIDEADFGGIECIVIEGMPEDGAPDMIAELEAFCVRPEFCCRHRWPVGDLVMWDNAIAIHLAICDYAPAERRLMHRTTVIGSEPF